MRPHTLVRIFLTLLLTILIMACTGPKGDKGETGLNGLGCSTTQLDNGSLIICPDDSTSIILNGPVGPKGDRGLPGQDLQAGAYNVVATINPCGKQGTHDEVLFKLNNGQILAHYSDANKQFLTLLSPGNYRTTDGTNCNFSVDSDFNVTW